MTNIEIATALLEKCALEQHRPTKTEFTKYLYLIDYCHWRLTGEKATDLDWKFYHYGPWDDAIDTILNRIGIQDMSMELPPTNAQAIALSDPISRILEEIVANFKGAGLRDLLDFVYNQTEPMRCVERRGDTLNFQTIRVDHNMPALAPITSPPDPSPISPRMLEKMESTRRWLDATDPAHEAAVASMKDYLESEDYATAMRLLHDDLYQPNTLPKEIPVKLSPETIAGLQSLDGE